MNKSQHTATLIFAATLAAAAPSYGASLMATYEFNNSFAANEPGMAATNPVNPLGLNQFQTDSVFGQSENVYRFDGSPAFASNAGLQLNTSGMIATNNYSVEMIFSLDTTSGYRRLVGVDDRTTDNGFYVLSDHLTVYPTGGSGPNLLTTTSYHHVILTVATDGTVSGYIDGLTDFSTVTSVMNITSPGQMLDFFLDDSVVQGEYSSGSIARLRIYDGALTAPEALALFNSQVPEPGTAMLGTLGCALLLRRRRRA
jgi:Concanavalin A-like lectin/glucanases superfamily